jgi:FtsP/CotA-like multicopper oxidase with cupredoxin domain
MRSRPSLKIRHQIAANLDKHVCMMMRHLNRRQFASGLLVLPLAAQAFAQDANSVQTITAKKTKSQLLGPESPPTEHWHFETASGQPIIRAKQGQELRLKIVNELDEPLWLHFFGVRAAADMMTVQVQPGLQNSLDVVFTPPDAGTFWFGPLLNASKHRELGLSGMLIVEEAINFSAPYADVPLIFDDWIISDDGKIETDFTNLERASGEGRLGNWFTVNGTFKPRIALPKDRTVRLRLLNVANTRSMNIAFKGVEALVIARDGQQLLPTPIGLKALELEPGQRADVVLLDAQEQVVIAIDLFEDVVEAAFLDASGYNGKNTLMPIIPPNPLPVLDPSLLPREVNIVLEGGQRGGLKSAKVGKDTLDLRAMLEQGLAWSIGGAAGLGSPPLFEAQFGETLALSFENKTAFSQPLYIHGHAWRVDPPTKGAFIGPQLPAVWSDTVTVPAKSTVRVLMVANNSGTWAIQSLMAERCDAGLIGAFTVADMP